VRLTVSATEDATLLDIVDNGPGVSDSARVHLFEPFFTTHSRGTGLGLYIARELSDANGATLDFVDNQPGAHFRLRGLNRSIDESWKGGGLSGS
jgi:two-component system sensor histidine kinase PilS (NtrC family)